MMAIKEEPRSVKRIVGLVHDEFDKEVSIDTIKRLLRRGGQVWKRVRTSIKNLRNKDESIKSEHELLELQAQHKAGVISLEYFDESGFCLTPVIPYAWQPKGETIEVQASRSKRVNVLGFLNIEGNLTPFIIEGMVNSEIVISYFDILCESITNSSYSRIIITYSCYLILLVAYQILLISYPKLIVSYQRLIVAVILVNQIKLLV